MKILRIIARLNTGGPARHVITLDEGLQARGHQTLLAHGILDAGEGSLEHLVVQRNVPAVKIPHLGRPVRPLGDAKALLRLFRIVFHEAPDVVHTHTAKAGVLGRVVAFIFNLTRRRHRRCLIVHTYHGHVMEGYFHPTIDIVVRLVERTLASITHRVVVVSRRQQNDIVERFSIAGREKTLVIPLGLELEPLLALAPTAPGLREKLSIPDDAIIVGYVGRMVPVKDLHTLVAAFSSAHAVNPGLWLLLVGDGPERVAIEARVRNSSIAQQVRFLGWAEDLLPVYATIDVCALSSISEGTPLAVIEAMAAGKPVVATAVGGVPDVLGDEAGLLVQPHDPETLAASILRLASSEDERRRMGACGRQRARLNYAALRLVDDIEQLYVSALREVRAELDDDAR